MRRVVAAVAVVLGATGALAQDEAGRQSPDFDPGALPAMYEAIDRNQETIANYKQCPSAIVGKSRGWMSYIVGSGELEFDDCAKNPAFCLKLCFEDRNENACFVAGRVLQEHAPDDKDEYSDKMFAQACALGHDAGCTNRGAGVRNDESPASGLADLPDKGACTFGAFEYACGKDDAWGCFMYGQALEEGEGTPTDLTAALKAYKQTCDGRQDFVACTWATDRIEALEGKQ